MSSGGFVIAPATVPRTEAAGAVARVAAAPRAVEGGGQP